MDRDYLQRFPHCDYRIIIRNMGIRNVRSSHRGYALLQSVNHVKCYRSVTRVARCNWILYPRKIRHGTGRVAVTCDQVEDHLSRFGGSQQVIMAGYRDKLSRPLIRESRIRRRGRGTRLYFYFTCVETCLHNARHLHLNRYRQVGWFSGLRRTSRFLPKNEMVVVLLAIPFFAYILHVPSIILSCGGQIQRINTGATVLESFIHWTFIRARSTKNEMKWKFTRSYQSAHQSDTID